MNESPAHSRRSRVNHRGGASAPKSGATSKNSVTPVEGVGPLGRCGGCALRVGGEGAGRVVAWAETYPVRGRSGGRSSGAGRVRAVPLARGCARVGSARAAEGEAWRGPVVGTLGARLGGAGEGAPGRPGGGRSTLPAATGFPVVLPSPDAHFRPIRRGR
ncbi:hypothetical protein KM043_001701 [Ampulex compressa]|nr:hypothetical protein KM043_001701 [Ampulex compressa]